MKNIIYRGALLVMVMFYTISCEDYLEKNPLDELSSGTFWQTKADVESALSACYARLQQGGIGSPGIIEGEALSDAAFSVNTWGGIQLPAKGQIESNTAGITQTIWTNCYIGIATCNKFIAKVGEVGLDATETNSFMAEAQFIRAYFYFQLYIHYGEVPIVLNDPSLDDIGTAKSTKEKVLEIIYSDLDFAIENLPSTIYAGHAVKSSAMAQKARVMLYNEDWSGAASLFKQIIDSDLYALYPDYQKMFLVEGQGADNIEILFSVKYLAPLSYHNLDQWYATFYAYSVLPEYLEKYEMSNGNQITDPGSGYDAENPYENRDPRLRWSVFAVEGEPWIGDLINGFNPALWPTGASLKKYVDPSVFMPGYETKSEQDIILIRYADVLLMYAEAQNESSGPDQLVYDAVNSVRARVNMPPLPVGLSKEQMRSRIRNERAVELFSEGWRYNDLKRWNIAHLVIPEVNDPDGVPRIFEQKHYLWPIPLSEIEKSKGTLVQNPDYN